ncbi:MAG: sarcosine oxidase subunit alpha family protein [Candidatus Puniceispirillales bacterium WSBS_2018_MAG_OTU23]
MTSFRVKNKGRINRDKPVTFTFDGKIFHGFEGDTVASALLANGVHLMGRSFKYHRPRGVVTAGSEEPNALIGTTHRGVGRFEPNTRATMQEIYQGLKTTSQNKWPSLKFDLGAINDRLYMLFSAGFYYKTFMWPRSFWDSVYEPLIRKAAGLGKAPTESDPDHYASRYLHCDVLIIGGGAAGIAAALTAGRTGAKVVLVDENPEMGGGILSEPSVLIDGQSGWQWLAAALAELDAMPNLSRMTRVTAIGYYHQNMIGMVEKITDHQSDAPLIAPRERMWRVRAGQVILAQGAIERPMVFDGNDCPGVMMASGAQTFLNRFGVLVGKRPIVLTSHDSAWYSAFDMADAGAEVTAIVDTRVEVRADLLEQAKIRGIMVLIGHTATATKGRLRVKTLRVNPVQDGRVGTAVMLGCDAVLVCGGWTPSLHLFSHTQGTLDWDAEAKVYLPGNKTEAVHIAGAGRGLWGIAAVLADGADAGAKAVNISATAAYTVADDRIGGGITQSVLPTDQNPNKAKAFVDFQNDVTAKDIQLAVREGMKSIEHVKRYTTNGMATDQGKLSNMNGLTIAADALGKDVPQVGLTTFRPPYTPTTFGAFAGYHKGTHFEVTRKTPIDAWADEHGAVFEPVALWRRAWYFPKHGEDMHQAVMRECRSTRESLGIFDASTLGKIEVSGPDATEFMNRFYTNPWTKLGVGKCRYGLLLGEDGYILDDGVIGRMRDDLFHVTTTTGGAARVLNMMEDYLQTEWPELNVWLTSTTEEWATIALNGPNARKLLEPLVEGADISAEAMSHMALVECTVDGIPARLFRVSFTGELGFEVNVPARHGRALWEKLMALGKPYNICPYGTETMHVLRCEKGFIIVGQDTDGTVTPHDAGMGWAIGKQKLDFVGKRSLDRPDITAAGRRQLVGLLTTNPQTVLTEGAQIIADRAQAKPMRMIGHVTSSYWSEVLGKSIAMAVVENGFERMGDMLYASCEDGNTVAVTVTGTAFYDPDGNRLKG